MRRTRQPTPMGMKIRMEMFQQNITVRELADRINKSEATICDVICGKNKSEVTQELILQELELKER